MPKRFASPSVKAFDDFLPADAVMQHEPVAAHRRRAVARADLFLPRDGDAVGGPAVEQAGFIGSPVAVRAEKLRPVLVWLVRAPTVIHPQQPTTGGGGDFGCMTHGPTRLSYGIWSRVVNAHLAGQVKAVLF